MTENPSETSLSLRDELTNGLDAQIPDTTAADAPPGTLPDSPPGTDGAPPAAGAPPVPAELPPLEAPSVWNAQLKEQFAKLAGTPEQRAAAEAWLNHWKEERGYQTKKEQEFAEYRRRLDPVYQVIAPYEQYWQMQGMTTEQGVGQIFAYARQLAEDPRGFLPQLAQMYGVDLQELVQEQPYVDPEVQALRQQIAELQQHHYQGQQHQQQQFHTRLIEEVRAFESAVDEQGQPKHPHFTRVFDRMVGLARGGLAQNLSDAYAMAVQMDSELQAEIAQQKAQAEAVTRAADVKRAQDASRTVSSKSVAEGAPPERSLRDEIGAQLDAAGYR